MHWFSNTKNVDGDFLFFSQFQWWLWFILDKLLLFLGKGSPVLRHFYNMLTEESGLFSVKFQYLALQLSKQSEVSDRYYKICK